MAIRVLIPAIIRRVPQGIPAMAFFWSPAFAKSSTMAMVKLVRPTSYPMPTTSTTSRTIPARVMAWDRSRGVIFISDTSAWDFI